MKSFSTSTALLVAIIACLAMTASSLSMFSPNAASSRKIVTGVKGKAARSAKKDLALTIQIAMRHFEQLDALNELDDVLIDNNHQSAHVQLEVEEKKEVMKKEKEVTVIETHNVLTEDDDDDDDVKPKVAEESKVKVEVKPRTRTINVHNIPSSTTSSSSSSSIKKSSRKLRLFSLSHKQAKVTSFVKVSPGYSYVTVPNFDKPSWSNLHFSSSLCLPIGALLNLLRR